MEKSDWIAFAACVAAFLGLIPQFHPIITKWRDAEEKKKITPKVPLSAPVFKYDKHDESNVHEDKIATSAFLKAIVLTSTALAIGVIEVVVFSWTASIFGVVVNTDTMPVNWLTVFYGLFLIPGFLLFLAFLNLATVFQE